MNTALSWTGSACGTCQAGQGLTASDLCDERQTAQAAR